MERVRCKICDYKAEKPTLESIIWKVLKDGGSLKDNTCPKCKNKSLLFNR